MERIGDIGKREMSKVEKEDRARQPQPQVVDITVKVESGLNKKQYVPR